MANVTRYEPFRGMVPLSEAMNELLRESFAVPRTLGRLAGASAGTNLYETKDAFVLQVALPGVSSEAVEISLRNDTVSLKAKSELRTPEGAQALWAGLTGTEFAQSFTIPSAVSPEGVTADLTDGILTLTLPKAEHSKPRMIKVNAGSANAQ
jgi:HSP20 family protein